MTQFAKDPEHKRLIAHRQRKKNWKQWGPYLSERAWGTVRESLDGDPWSFFPFEEAHKGVYRWGEDGLGGFCDRFQYICFSLALWNGSDPILKERFFGLTSHEGNHGEDVKESYYYLDGTPTSSYCKMLYRYPQALFPYEELKQENRKRTKQDPEFELEDTGIFDKGRYFDVEIEYAKKNETDIFCRITVTNQGDEEAPITLLPTIWFRNTWSWGYPNGPTGDDGGKPRLRKESDQVALNHPVIGRYYLAIDEEPLLIFCENEENVPYSKEAFHTYVVEKKPDAINPKEEGTKAAGVLFYTLAPKEKKRILCRISQKKHANPFTKFNELFTKRIHEADAFYKTIQKPSLSPALKSIQRQAFAGMLFSKQFYYYDQLQWIEGDPNRPRSEQGNRNLEWEHLTTFDIISMPDSWEYPYFCAWDTAFHCIPHVMIDPDFAKRQLTLMTREWYMHPNGQFPAYEWAFSDVNPPVHAWALWRIYKIDAKTYGKEDLSFLEGNFHKLLINFTWWINKKDVEGKNLFQGGFLGMDNISVFDRSRSLPTGGHIDQSDGSAWMSFYCISMMKIALHLAEKNSIYQDMATKFFEHFLRISTAMTKCGGEHALWDNKDGFFYDVLHLSHDEMIPLKVRSLVGLLPLLAVETIEAEVLDAMPTFHRRINWFIQKRSEVACNLACLEDGGSKNRRLLSIVSKEQLLSILSYLLDEDEFLSRYGIRSLSKYHEKNPYILEANSQSYEVRYVPGESDNEMFGGNSNWRGPVWIPINFLLIEALQKYHHYYGDELKVEFPTRSGNWLTLWDVASQLSCRLIRLFPPDAEHTLFHEYYHGETGKGLGASHQTGWTGLLAKLIQQSGEFL